MLGQLTSEMTFARSSYLSHRKLKRSINLFQRRPSTQTSLPRSTRCRRRSCRCTTRRVCRAASRRAPCTTAASARRPTTSRPSRPWTTTDCGLRRTRLIRMSSTRRPCRPWTPRSPNRKPVNSSHYCPQFQSDTDFICIIVADGSKTVGFRVSGEDADTLPAGTGSGTCPLHGPEPSDVPVARYAHELPAAAGVDNCFVTDYSLLNLKKGYFLFVFRFKLTFKFVFRCTHTSLALGLSIISVISIVVFLNLFENVLSKMITFSSFPFNSKVGFYYIP